jgi:hypothetical protein
MELAQNRVQRRASGISGSASSLSLSEYRMSFRVVGFICEITGQNNIS